jgi:hypothetical protein
LLIFIYFLAFQFLSKYAKIKIIVQDIFLLGGLYSFLFMFDYLQQFNKLPKELRDKVSSPAAMDVLMSLEKKYGVNLAMLVMQVMVKQVMFKDLPAYFSTEMNLSLEQAEALTKELREKLFFSIATYLGLKPVLVLDSEEKSLEVLMKENNIILPSQELLSRCRKILLTYRKGVRSKIDARLSLEKDIVQGGLGLDTQTAEKLLRAVDRQSLGASDEQTGSDKIITGISSDAQSEIDQLINKQEAGSAYSLKQNIERGELKVPEILANRFQKKLDKLDLEHELEAPDKILALEGPHLEAEKKDESKKPYLNNLVPPAPPRPNFKQEISVDDKNSKGKEVIELQSRAEKEELEAGSLSSDKVAAVANLGPTLSGQSFKKENKEKHSSLFAKFSYNKGKAIESKKSPEDISSNKLEEMVKTASLQSQLKSRPAASSDSRLRMEDVKLRPKVMGPLEELRYLDLVNFRRLGDNPEEITKKIIIKIKLLERDGYDYLVKGVQAWRQSPVNKTYLRLMQEAINNGVTLNEVLKVRQNAHKETLTKEEIEAIVAMNNKLMF